MSHTNVYNLENASDFQEVLEQPYLIVLKIFADWCGPCKAYAPLFEECARSYIGSNVYFISADIKQNLVKVESLPTTLFIKDKQIIDRFVGIDMDALHAGIKANM